MRRQNTQFLTTAQAATALGTTKRTLLNWIKAGKVVPPEVDPGNGYYRWSLADIESIRASLREAQ